MFGLGLGFRDFHPFLPIPNPGFVEVVFRDCSTVQLPLCWDWFHLVKTVFNRPVGVAATISLRFAISTEGLGFNSQAVYFHYQFNSQVGQPNTVPSTSHHCCNVSSDFEAVLPSAELWRWAPHSSRALACNREKNQDWFDFLKQSVLFAADRARVFKQNAYVVSADISAYY